MNRQNKTRDRANRVAGSYPQFEWPRSGTHLRTLKHLFLDELSELYDGEERLVIAIPKMIKAATCTHLRKLFRSHLKETASHVKTVEKVFLTFEEKPLAKKCEATIGLLKEGDEIAANFNGSAAINAALIAVAQKVGHYKIASYGCLREWAALLGNKVAAGLLQEALVEEKAANHSLSELARFRSNHEAAGECAPADLCHGSNGAMPSHGRRGMRPLCLHPLRPGLM
ncbi:MAG TPA: ferritin-like domain-containing protein [Candidatus Angelobacter sp.]|nr:ferritin-like domain-containing protein [Candidatus Angelobacter sp.]